MCPEIYRLPFPLSFFKKNLWLCFCLGTVNAVVDGSMNATGGAYRYTEGYASIKDASSVSTFRIRQRVGGSTGSNGSSRRGSNFGGGRGGRGGSGGSGGSGGVQAGSVALLERKLCGRLGKVFS